jgi:hypothetical protein
MAIRPSLVFVICADAAYGMVNASPLRRLLDQGASATLPKGYFCGNMPGV